MLRYPGYKLWTDFFEMAAGQESKSLPPRATLGDVEKICTKGANTF
jgi:hypothetical protein